MIITRKLKYDTPDLYMSNNRLNLVNEIKLLGLIIDNKLTFKSHVAAICKKAADIYKQLACAAKVTWGLNSEITRTIYVAVIEPIVLYAASVWHPATELQMIKNQLHALQRGFAQKICKSYRTVSLTSASALVLSGLLPLDLRIQEAARLYLAKKHKSRDYLPPGKDLENCVIQLEQPHPSELINTNYKLLDSLDQKTLESHQITGPHIYTDGSKLEGKVGAALTWWEEGKEIDKQTFKLDPACTVFQAELYALHRAVLLAKRSDKPIINIMSDSRSALELLENPKVRHPLAMKIKRNIKEISGENRTVRLFWIRAHVGTPGNERADELAKEAALNADVDPHYSKIPLSYIKRNIREESVLKWQDRYITSQTGRVTKIFFPEVRSAYSTIRKIKITPLMCQAFTGHGGLGEYLHRFKLRNSPGCECDGNISETVEHIILDCPRFAKERMEVEFKMDATLTKHELKYILADSVKRNHLLGYIENILRTVTKRNSTLIIPKDAHTNQTATSADPINPPAATQDNSPLCVKMTNEQLLRSGERGEPGIRVRGVALFMDTNLEKLGICFCNAHAKGRVVISPGLAALLNGSTSKNTMRRSTYDALPETTVARNHCRIVRAKNKTIALFQWNLLETPFTQANLALQHLAKTNSASPKRISVDSMAVGYEKGTVDNYLGCIEASEKHEIVVYENRGEDLSFLRRKELSFLDAQNQEDGIVETPEALSGSERLQMKRTLAENPKPPGKTKLAKRMLSATVSTMAAAFKSIPGSKEQIKSSKSAKTTLRVGNALHSFNEPKPNTSDPTATTRTRADKGQVNAPVFRHVRGSIDHVINAFLEFQAITRAEHEVSRKTCEDIMQAYLHGNTPLLKVRLEEAKASIYNNNTSQTIIGEEVGHHMAAYCSTRGFVEMDEEETKANNNQPKFRTNPDDPVVVVAKCTRIMLNKKILEIAKTIAGSEDELLESWQTPKFTWVNGVPGCGKTTWIVRNFDPKNDVIITTTTEAAKDLREKLESSIGADAKNKVRTMASVLANGFREPDRKRCNRLMIDEALMNHFGAIVMATRLADASETLLIGDKNQLPYIDRNNLFELHYSRPNKVAKVTQELLCTHRNPMDVAYALSDVYDGIYSSKLQPRSLSLRRYTGTEIPKSMENTLYLTHTQSEKELLKAEGYGSGAGSRVNTIHEAQGATFETVVIVRTTQTKKQIHEQVPHAVVAVSRHTNSCTYYTDDESDAISRFVLKAEKSTLNNIREYNIKMAIHNGDVEITRKIITSSTTNIGLS